MENFLPFLVSPPRPSDWSHTFFSPPVAEHLLRLPGSNASWTPGMSTSTPTIPCRLITVLKMSARGSFCHFYMFSAKQPPPSNPFLPIDFFKICPSPVSCDFTDVPLRPLGTPSVLEFQCTLPPPSSHHRFFRILAFLNESFFNQLSLSVRGLTPTLTTPSWRAFQFLVLFFLLSLSPGAFMFLDLFIVIAALPSCFFCGLLPFLPSVVFVLSPL